MDELDRKIIRQVLIMVGSVGLPIFIGLLPGWCGLPDFWQKLVPPGARAGLLVGVVVFVLFCGRKLTRRNWIRKT